MKCKTFHLLTLILTILYSCQNEKKPTVRTTSGPISQSENQQDPNYNYKIDLPVGWGMSDTTMQGLRCRFILAPASLDNDKPRANIVIASMEGRETDDFTTRNMDYLKENIAGTVILERGSIKISSINARWFTYTKEQNGVVRDMINYIIPVRRFAYMLTCGTNTGSMKKYRPIFDRIAKSFRE